MYADSTTAAGTGREYSGSRGDVLIALVGNWWLLIIMGIKFYLIAAYFMHLKWDRPILRRAFMTGIGIALVVYVITLTAFKFWNGPGFMPH